MSRVGDVIELQKQDVKVERCDDCNNLMVNIDADEVLPGDFVTLKRKGVRLSNPETEDPICLKCEVDKKPGFVEKLSDWFDTDNNDDTSFFTPSSGGGFNLGGGGFSFGGGSFSGGGATRGF